MTLRGVLLPIAVVALVLGIWEGAVRWGGVPAYLLPTPSRIAMTFWDHLGLLAHHAGATAAAIALGLLAATGAGLALAAAMAASPTFERAAAPFLVGSQMLPVFAVAPLLVVWLGYGLLPKALVAALVAFFPIAIGARDGLRQASGETKDLLRSMGASRRQTFVNLLFPASLPAVFSSLKVAATLCVVGATIGEWVGARRGLGFLMLEANARLRVDLVFASILFLALVALSLFGALRIIERRLLHWRDGGTRG
ncbi:MAG: ABC transporter permease [Candidatus Bipolaricaulota bacterium]